MNRRIRRYILTCRDLQVRDQFLSFSYRENPRLRLQDIASIAYQLPVFFFFSKCQFAYIDMLRAFRITIPLSVLSDAAPTDSHDLRLCLVLFELDLF